MLILPNGIVQLWIDDNGPIFYFNLNKFHWFNSKSDLLEDGVRLEDKEIVDERARHAALNVAVFERPLPPVDFRVWQDLFCWESSRGSRTLWTLVDSLTPYSRRFLFDLGLRVKGRTGNLSRIMSGHYTAWWHMNRFRIVEGAICICVKDYEAVDHLLWYCERLVTKRHLALPSEICVLWRSNGRWSAVWISPEVLELEFDNLAVLFYG
jgi:hypothetical protein